MVSTTLFADLAAHTAAGAHLRIVPGGHWLPRTHPQLVARVISEMVALVETGEEAPDLRRARLTSAAPS